MWLNNRVRGKKNALNSGDIPCYVRETYCNSGSLSIISEDVFVGGTFFNFYFNLFKKFSKGGILSVYVNYRRRSGLCLREFYAICTCEEKRFVPRFEAIDNLCIIINHWYTTWKSFINWIESRVFCAWHL